MNGSTEVDVNNPEYTIDPHKEVTGGDLYGLWRNANEVLPRVEGVYNKVIPQIMEVTSGQPLRKFGLTGQMLMDNATYLEKALFGTSKSISLAGEILNKAINEYTYVDGENAGDLSMAGKQLNAIIIEQGDELYDPPDLPDDYDGPDSSLPGIQTTTQ